MRNLVSYQISETLFRKKKQYVPPMLPSRLPKSDANLNRCFTSTKCKKILNRKIIYRVDRILTIKLLATKKTFERFSIAFHVFPIKMSLPLSPFIRDTRRNEVREHKRGENGEAYPDIQEYFRRRFDEIVHAFQRCNNAVS